MKSTFASAGSLFFFIFLLLAFLPLSQAQTLPDQTKNLTTDKPVFSHPAGFYTSDFDLAISSAQSGTYTYTVSAAGYQNVSGQATITDKDLLVTVSLPQSLPGKSMDNNDFEKNLFAVTFRVNTSNTSVVAGDKVYMSGNIVSPNWPAPGTVSTMLMQPESAGSAVYVLRLNLAAGQYHYKYFRNDGWDGGEWGGDPNRVVNVAADATINDAFANINPLAPNDQLFKISFNILNALGNPIPDASITFNGIVFQPGHYVFGGLKPAATIRYTTDGSMPTETSQVFSSPVSITSRTGQPNVFSLIPTNNVTSGSEMWRPPAGEVFKINTIRARSFAPGMQPSQTISASYIIDQAGANRFSLPVVSIMAHQGAFFNADTGIYVFGKYNNYFQNADEWERLTHFEYFEIDGNLAISQNLGVRTHGGSTRNRPRKSLRFYARDEYGESWVNYRLFPDKPIFKFKRFLMRNSGNDWDQAIFRDAFMQSLIKDMAKVDLQYSQPVVAFLNGEYWGVHNLRDRYDSRYMETHYGLGELEYVMLENNNVLDNGNPDGVAHFQELLLFLHNYNMATLAHYTALQTRMDVESFIDHQVAQIYFMNTDWPGNNLQYWRKMTPAYQPNAPYGHDGRWRWMIKDTDFGFGLNFGYVPGVNEGPAHNTLAFALSGFGPGWPNPPWSTFIFRRLVQSEQFRQQLINRFCDFLNTSFKKEFVLARLEEYRQVYLPEMEEHIHRWRTPANLNTWQQHIDRMANFGSQRPGHLKQHIKNQFALGDMANITVSSANPAQGGVRVNRLLPHQIPNPFTGQYFKAVPVEVQAVAKPGFRFSHWQGLPAGSPALATISLTKDTTLVAWFANTLIHYWHFNNLAEGVLTTVAADFSLNQGAVITYPGTGTGFLDRTDGTLLNASMGAPAGYGLRVRNPSNTRELIIVAPSTGYRELQLSFAVHRTSSGAQSQQLFYSADGGQNWINVGEAYIINLDYTGMSFDLSAIEAINNNPNLRFRILFTGEAAAGTTGNNRIDNFSITGVSASLTLNPANPPAAVLNTFYGGHTFSVSGGTSPFTFKLASGMLPQGISLAPNGTLSGTPIQAGAFNFIIEVTDKDGATDSKPFVLIVDEKALIHYWNFNNLPDQVFTNVSSDISLSGSGSISYPGTGAGYLDRTDGTLLNARRNAPAGFGLRVRNPSSTREMIIVAPSAGYSNLVLSFGVHRTNNGAQQQELYYSADNGANWLMIGEQYAIAENYETKTFDLGTIAAVNNNPELRFRILFKGEAAAGASGNNRFDNIALEGTSLSVGINERLNRAFKHHNFPNPFSNSTTISFEVTDPGQVKVAVYDIGGRLIEVLTQKWHEPGYHEINFDAAALPGGVYIYRIITGQGVSSSRILKIN